MEKADIEKLLIAKQTDLLRYAMSLTRDTDKAYDLLQETNLKIILSGEKFDGRDFKNWSFRVMRNAFVNNCRRKDQYSLYEDLWLEQCEFRHPVYNRSNDSGCNIRDIYNALNALPAEHNKAIRLLIIGLKYQEIAYIRNAPLGTIKNRICVSRVILKQRLKEFLHYRGTSGMNMGN